MNTAATVKKVTTVLSISGLKAVGVIWAGSLRALNFECEECGQQWSPQMQTGGRLPSGYWQCPNGCNCRCKGDI